MLTKVRNANSSGKDKVDIKSSKINSGILDILKREKFIQNYKPITDDKQGRIRVYLLRDQEGVSAIHGLKRVSKPGLRVYAGSKEIPRVLGGLGITVVSTSLGLMTNSEAREKGLGGELLCSIW